MSVVSRLLSEAFLTPILSEVYGVIYDMFIYLLQAYRIDIGVPQGSVLGPLLFAVYCSPVADVIAHCGVQYHHYADDMQLHLSMRTDNTTARLSILAKCTMHRRTTVVSTEWSAAKPGQIRSADRRNE